MGTPNYYQESLEILLEILLEKLLSTQAGNRPNTLFGLSPVADTSIRLLYMHQIILQASDYYTSIRILYKHQTNIQASDMYARNYLVGKQ